MSGPKKVNLESKNITEETLEELKRLMPSVFKEGKIDFDSLKAVLGDVVEPSREFYNFTWAGKSEAFRTLQRPSTATLKPCEEESKEWDKTENLFIEGDNLEVLKLLQKSYRNSIKMIYIDPPYNKDKDFVYPDRWSEGIKSYKEFCGFVDSDGNITTSVDEAKNAAGRKHSKWLTMMYPRLFLARNLLMDDGVIFVSIDDDEAANLKKIMDEIFGEENFVAQLIWKSGRTAASYFTNEHEYVLCYSKNKISLPLFKFDGDENISDRAIKRVTEKNPIGIIAFPKGIDFECDDKVFPNEFGNIETIRVVEGVFECKNKKLASEVKLEAAWTMKDMIESWLDGEMVVDQKGQIVKRFFFKNNGILHYEKEKGTIHPKSILADYSTKNGTNALKSLFDGKSFFDFPKPPNLIRLFCEIICNKNDIILDFFAGSGTTAHAVMALNAEDGGNRKFICVQIPEPTPENSEAKKAGYKSIAEISKERIRRAGEKVKTDNPLFAGDIGFKVFKLDESNFKQWDKEVADAETLKQQIIEFADNVRSEASKKDMLYELLLKKGFNLNAKVEKKQIADNEIFVVDGSMFVCLDDKISTTTIDEVIKLRPAHFIVLDRAFEGNDRLKLNTWQTFKSLFPNDENPFETV